MTILILIESAKPYWHLRVTLASLLNIASIETHTIETHTSIATNTSITIFILILGTLHNMHFG